MYLKEYCFKDCWKNSFVARVAKNFGKRSMTRKYHTVNFIFPNDKTSLEHVINRFVNHLRKYSLFSCFLLGLSTFHINADLMAPTA